MTNIDKLDNMHQSAWIIVVTGQHPGTFMVQALCTPSNCGLVLGEVCLSAAPNAGQLLVART